MASDVDSHPEDDETWLAGFPLDGSEEESRVSASAIRVSSSLGRHVVSVSCASNESGGQISNFQHGG
jgi:hypothetical protein